MNGLYLRLQLPFYYSFSKISSLFNYSVVLFQDVHLPFTAVKPLKGIPGRAQTLSLFYNTKTSLNSVPLGWIYTPALLSSSWKQFKQSQQLL